MFAILLVIAMFNDGSTMATSSSDEECPPQNKTCTYYFRVHNKISMLYKNTGKSVYPHRGKLWKYPNFTHEVSTEDVLSLDGFQRMVVAINNRVPGPPIIVYEGQTVVVKVTNKMLTETVTVHWHGIQQRGTPWMDGVGWVTQCPIGSGQVFTYQFKADRKGTYWYHSHVGAQRSDGLFGAFIIKERNPSNDIEDKIMIVGDWQHEMSEQVYLKKKLPVYDKNGKKYKVPFSGLINGKGRYTDAKNGETIGAPLTQYNVTKGRKYRFRIIQSGNLYAVRVSVDNHTLSVVATDGFNVQPKEVESIIVYPGERYDFILTANRDVGNYWIRAVRHKYKENYILAILHYNGAPPDEQPNTSRTTCTKNSPCTVANCPFLAFPENENIKCVLLTEFESSESNPAAPEMKAGESEEYFLNFGKPGGRENRFSINGRRFTFGGSNLLTQSSQSNKNVDCNENDCGFDRICTCLFDLKISPKKTIQMVWTNLGDGSSGPHPIHLHAHSFHVVKMNFPEQNMTTGKTPKNVMVTNKDINCGGGKNYCNNPTWADPSWANGNVPGLNIKNPPRKDTLIIPPGGYVIIRFYSDNPGKWIMHCHIEDHQLSGMAMILSEGEVKSPPGLPVCQNFYNDVSKDYNYVLADTIKTNPKDKVNSHGTNVQGHLSVTALYGVVVCLINRFIL